MIKIGAVFIPVTDVKKAIEWYRDKLNLSHVGTWPKYKGADFYFTAEKQYLSLVKVNEKQSTAFTVHSNYENSYFNFTTNDLDSYRKELRDRGVQVSDIIDHGTVLGFDFYDLDGNKFEVIVDKEDVSDFYKKE